MAKTGAELAREVSNFINGASSSEVNAFVEQMEQEHRTLQQSFTRLCMKWIKNLAGREHYDDRNKASVELAQVIEKAVPDYYKHLPLI